MPDSPNDDIGKLNHHFGFGKALYSIAYHGYQMSMSGRYIFGYGSLVNRDTHDYPEVHCAQLTGWRRMWRHTQLQPVAYLTAVPDGNSQIDGLILAVAPIDKNLDKRENAYDRHDVGHAVTHSASGAGDIEVYAVDEMRHGRSENPHPIYLSYLDVVVQGYFREFGELGVANFFETTDGWDGPVLDDRSNPHYPRHLQLSADETDLTDDWLGRLSAVVKQL